MWTPTLSHEIPSRNFTYTFQNCHLKTSKTVGGMCPPLFCKAKMKIIHRHTLQYAMNMTWNIGLSTGIQVWTFFPLWVGMWVMWKRLFISKIIMYTVIWSPCIGCIRDFYTIIIVFYQWVYIHQQSCFTLSPRNISVIDWCFSSVIPDMTSYRCKDLIELKYQVMHTVEWNIQNYLICQVNWFAV